MFRVSLYCFATALFACFSIDLLDTSYSRHGAALKKNVPNLTRKVRSDDPILKKNKSSTDLTVEKQTLAINSNPPRGKFRKFSEAVDIEAVMQPLPSTTATTANGESDESGPKYEIYHAKPTNVTLKTISLTYGKSQIVSALVGGFAITPSGKSSHVTSGHFSW
jgi:hypothetical protein